MLHLSTAIIKPRLLPTSKFKYATMAPEAEEEDRVIDYTPRYAIMPRVPYRILRLYGNSSFDGSTKYFVSLREPAARAISAWEYKFMGIRAGGEWAKHVSGDVSYTVICFGRRKHRLNQPMNPPFLADSL